MTEEEAKAWLDEHLNVPRETFEKLERFAALVIEENRSQNLISRASEDEIWARHIVDSAQLVPLAEAAPAPKRWLDLGSGAGFPGIVAAILHDGAVTLVESRRLRVEFLTRAAAELDLDVEVIGSRVEQVQDREYEVISARAFAPLPRLLDVAAHLSTTKSVWVLPKGRNAQSELEAVAGSWQGRFSLQPSATDPEAQIIVATGISRKARGRQSGKGARG